MNSEMNQTAKILIVDDDEVSVMGLQRAIRKINLPNKTRVARDGLEALDILRGAAGEERLLPPYIVLLDINMPRMNGHEFLNEIRNDPDLRRMLVFVLTTSDAPEDITLAYEKNIAGYVLKDDLFKSLTNALDMVGHVTKTIILPER